MNKLDKPFSEIDAISALNQDKSAEWFYENVSLQDAIRFNRRMERNLITLSEILKNWPITDEGQFDQDEIETFWHYVSKMDWTKDNDYDRINKWIHEKMTSESFEKFKKIRKEKFQQLKLAIERWEYKTNNNVGLGDDGFSDLIYHIIGCGKEIYNQAVHEPTIAWRMAKNGQYEESFGYVRW